MTMHSPSFYVVDYLVGLDPSALDQFVDNDPNWGRMIFRDALPMRLTGTGKRAITASNAPGGLYPNSDAVGNIVSMRLYADHTRDINGNADSENGVDRAWAMFGLLNQILNKPLPIMPGDPFVQLDRTSQPLESYDEQMDAPYVAVNYDVGVLATV